MTHPNTTVAQKNPLNFTTASLAAFSDSSLTPNGERAKNADEIDTQFDRCYSHWDYSHLGDSDIDLHY